MAGKTKSATARKSGGKSKNSNNATQMLEDLTSRLGALAGDAATALKDAGIATKKKAGEAASHLPVGGDGDKPKGTRKRSSSSGANGKKSSAAKASTAKSNGKKSSSASTKASSSKSGSAKSGGSKSSGSKSSAKSS